MKVIRYMITDGQGSYLKLSKSGGYVPESNIALGDKWETREKAKNIIRSSLKKSAQETYKVIAVEINDDSITVITRDSIVKQIGDMPIEDNNLLSLVERIESLAEAVHEAELRKEVLNEKMGSVDKEIVDIQHYIEFGNCNAYQGWLAFKMLRSKLQQRRKIKDEVQILRQLGECKVCSSTLGDIITEVEKLNTRKYFPRMLPEIFE